MLLQLLRHLDNLDNFLKKNFIIPTSKRIVCTRIKLNLNWGGSLYFICKPFRSLELFSNPTRQHTLCDERTVKCPWPHESKIEYFIRFLANAARYILAKRESGSNAWIEPIKGHIRHILFSGTQISGIYEHANEIRHYPLWDKLRFLEAPFLTTVTPLDFKKVMQIKLHPDNINRTI